jgi:hypothetical protein
MRATAKAEEAQAPTQGDEAPGDPRALHRRAGAQPRAAIERQGRRDDDVDFAGKPRMTKPIEEECASCRFALIHDEEDETYTCHRRAPQRFDLDFVLDALRSIAVSQLVISNRKRGDVDSVLGATGSVLGYMPLWPEVAACDWCGEYEPKETRCTEEPSVEHRVDLTDLRKSLGRLYGIVKDMERAAE